MTKTTLKKAVHRFAKDQSGAAMIEYSVLVGIITAGVIATVVIVGEWVGNAWTGLEAELDT